jgi:hypothetical protein
MPYDLRLSQTLRQAGWKVKIHDLERLESPHVTIYRKRRKWRLALRDGAFLDPGDKWSQIDGRVWTAVQDAWDRLQQEWDRIHPDNPVRGQDDGDGDGQEKSL